MLPKLFYKNNQTFARLDSKSMIKNIAERIRKLGICLKCKGTDVQHETNMPSKRFEIQNGKKVEVCDGFSIIPAIFYETTRNIQEVQVAPKVIA